MSSSQKKLIDSKQYINSKKLDLKFVFSTKHFLNVQMVWNLERTSGTKLSTIQKKKISKY